MEPIRKFTIYKAKYQHLSSQYKLWIDKKMARTEESMSYKMRFLDLRWQSRT